MPSAIINASWNCASAEFVSAALASEARALTDPAVRRHRCQAPRDCSGSAASWDYSARAADGAWAAECTAARVDAHRPMLKLQAIETAPDRLIMIPGRVLAEVDCELKPPTWASKRRIGARRDGLQTTLP